MSQLKAAVHAFGPAKFHQNGQVTKCMKCSKLNPSDARYAVPVPHVDGGTTLLMLCEEHARRRTPTTAGDL